MTENLPAPARKPKDKSAPHQVTGKLREACNLMIFGNDAGEPLEYDEAAKEAGLTVRAMRMALEKPHVRNYLRQQRAILVASFHSTNPLHIARMRDKSSNQMVRLQAARAIEDMGGEAAATDGRRPTSPGVTIIIGAPAPPAIAVGGRTITTPYQLLEHQKDDQE